MSDIKSLQPPLRFADFKECWQNKTLDETVNFFSGLTYSPNNIVKSNGTLVLRSSNVQNGQLTFNDNVYVNSNVVNSSNVKIGDIAVVVRNGSKSLIGKHAQVLVSMPNTVIGAFMTGIRTNQSGYINALLDTPLFKKAVDKNLGATINQITTGAFKEMEFNFSSSDKEQTQIGDFFQNIDKQLTLHQVKHRKLQQLKKAMLGKMFPKAGAKVPEVRFAGFTGDWEERPLSALCTKTYGGGTPTTSNDSYWNGETAWIQSSDLDERLFNVNPRKSITASGLKNSATKLIPSNSIAIITRVGVGKLALMETPYATSQDFLSLSGLKVDAFFAVYSIKELLKVVLHSVQGTSIKGITKEELLMNTIMVTTIPAEQTKIGSYFQNLDRLIALQQQQINKLKNIKQAYLKQMFI
jgi:type I restriction enzyme S subunit